MASGGRGVEGEEREEEEGGREGVPGTKCTSEIWSLNSPRSSGE